MMARRGISAKLGDIPAEGFTVKKGGKTAFITFGTEGKTGAGCRLQS